MTEQVIPAHLSGDLELGLYPLLDGDRCQWLAADFDGATAVLDALAYLKAAEAAVQDMGTGGRVVLVAEAVLAGEVPDATPELERRIAARLSLEKHP